jgi:hypothetical protein
MLAKTTWNICGRWPTFLFATITVKTIHIFIHVYLVKTTHNKDTKRGMELLQNLDTVIIAVDALMCMVVGVLIPLSKQVAAFNCTVNGTKLTCNLPSTLGLVEG